MLTPAQARRTLMSLRTLIGWSAMLMPRVLLRIFGVDPAAQPSTVHALRLFGIRDILMAYQLYQNQTIHSTADEMEETLRQGIAVDGIDAISGVAAGLRGDISLRTTLMGSGTAALAAALGYQGRDAAGPSAVERS
ncbi:MAG: hypothetical protein ACKVHU_03760 [Acidimicrobiales bacterium]|jgi:uncharacterized membrane protein (DUF4010 family)